MSSLVTELLEECYPVLERVCVLLETAQKAQQSTRKGLRESMALAEAELVPYVSSVSAQFDMFMETAMACLDPGKLDPCISPPERTEGKGDAGVLAPLGAGGNPRVVTRGSGIPTPLPSNAPTEGQTPALARVSRGSKPKPSPKGGRV